MTTAALPETRAAPPPGRSRPRGRGRAVALLAGLLFVYVLVRTAWLCDDAYITFRTVDNFVHGHGLRWNVAERVQTFTNPLWTFAMAALHRVTGDVYYTSLALSMLLSAAVVALLLARFAREALPALLAGAVLVGSRAFVDFSTSGLENPLSHALLLGFLVVYARPPEARRILPLALLAGLAVLNRADLVLLFLPPLLAATAGARKEWRTWRDLALGFLPVVVWEVFSIVYYGFPFPNTFYAKLPDSVGLGDRIQHGLEFFQGHWTEDPITPAVVLAGCLLPLVLRAGRWVPVALGIAVYLAYVIQVGGDFMLGRFLTCALLASLVVVLRCLEGRPRGLRAGAALGAVVLACMSPAPPLATTSHYGEDLVITGAVVLDERHTYYPCTGLLRAGRPADPGPVSVLADFRELLRSGGENEEPGVRWWRFWERRPGPEHWSREKAEKDRAAGVTHMVQHMVGFYGFYAGPGIYVLDRFALGDALLARIPVVKIHTDRDTGDPVWAAGHLRRPMPEGYHETLLNDRNLLESPELARFYDALKLVIRGPLLDPDRWREIWKLNRGAYDDDLSAYARTVEESGQRFSGLPIYVFHAARERFQAWAETARVTPEDLIEGSADPERWADELRSAPKSVIWVVVPTEAPETPTAEARRFLDVARSVGRQATPFAAEGLMAYLFLLE